METCSFGINIEEYHQHDHENFCFRLLANRSQFHLRLFYLA